MNKESGNIILIGFMGSGKTTFGKWIANNKSYSFCDTDEYIEKKQGMKVKDIFAVLGESAFRDMETQALKDMCRELRGTVISVGGGLPVREENRKLLKELGMVAYLRTTEETLIKRLSNDTERPLLAGGDIKEKIHTLMNSREQLYIDTSDIILTTDNMSFEQMYKSILFRERGREYKMKFIVVNGPNINFLGIREKGIYGEQNYETLVKLIEDKSDKLGVEVEVFQSNYEGAIIDKLQHAYYDNVDGIIINPGAFTHYSYAIRDALASIAEIPKIEVHISNVHTREEFRHTSVTVPVCNGQVVGLGLKGYLFALEAIMDLAQNK